MLLLHSTPSFRPSHPRAPVSLSSAEAHRPFLVHSTSIQGASQAMEDGVTIACTLKLAGKEDVPMAIRAFEKIRFVIFSCSFFPPPPCLRSLLLVPAVSFRQSKQV